MATQISGGMLDFKQMGSSENPQAPLSTQLFTQECWWANGIEEDHLGPLPGPILLSSFT